MNTRESKLQSGRQRLRGWIERSKFTSDAQAAETLGVHPVVLSQWLSGTRQPGLDNAIHLEQVTGIAAESWLLNDVSDSDETVTVAPKRANKTGR